MNWQNTNRLEQGRLLLLVAFSEKGSELFWMVVTHSDPWLLERGLVGVEFVHGDPLFLLHCLEFNRLMGTSHHTRLCESQIFFPAYRPVLQTLRNLSHNVDTLPFQSYFVYGNPQPYRPPYIRDNIELFHEILERHIEVPITFHCCWAMRVVCVCVCVCVCVWVWERVRVVGVFVIQ